MPVAVLGVAHQHQRAANIPEVNHSPRDPFTTDFAETLAAA